MLKAKTIDSPKLKRIIQQTKLKKAIINNQWCDLGKPHFLVGAFLEKRVDYIHGFSSVFFFDTPEVTEIVLQVLQNFMVSD